MPSMPPPVARPFGDYQPMWASYSPPPQIVMHPMSGGSGGPGGYTWHLSIIDAGQPRRDGSGDQFAQYPQSTLFDPVSWTGADLDQSQWILADENGTPIKTIRFGMPGATPVAGDWNGDGTTKVGVFIDGLWFLDLNGNGLWDEGDLWAKLGKKGDQPVSRRLERRRQDRHRHLRPGVDRRPEGRVGRAGPARRPESAGQGPPEERAARRRPTPPSAGER